MQNGYELDHNYPDLMINETIKQCAKRLNLALVEGCVHSSDVFYRNDPTPYYETLYQQYGCLAVEMESFALFHNANVLHKKAACLLTISDSFVAKEELSAKEREQSFTNMMTLALESFL